MTPSNESQNRQDQKIPLKYYIALGLLFYTATRAPIDIFTGYDSVFSRYIARPVLELVSDGGLQTEEQYQSFLTEMKNLAPKDGVKKTILDIYRLGL